MSDLETLEADMMRDQSRVDAAPATLRPEESQPGLDPDNPGAAPDTIGLTGDYAWTASDPAGPFRPLRDVRITFPPLAA